MIETPENVPVSSPSGVAAESTAQRIAAGLARLGQVARHQFWSDAGGADGGLNPTQAQILLHLGRQKGSPPRLAGLAAELGITPPTASDSVAALISKGLVSKGPVAGDARGVAIALTPAGLAQSSRLAERSNVLADVAASLPPAEQAALLRSLMAMVRDLQARGAIPAARMCASCRYFTPYAHTQPHGPVAKPHHCAFIDAPIGDGDLRLDCPDHEPAPAAGQSELWHRFNSGTASSMARLPPDS